MFAALCAALDVAECLEIAEDCIEYVRRAFLGGREIEAGPAFADTAHLLFEALPALNHARVATVARRSRFGCTRRTIEESLQLSRRID